jgi:pSer/pThr/pTyr-binding forkhead associated (FHA) protein
MKSTLEITGGGREPRSVPLQEGTTTIGRADTNVVVLDHANISRSHLEIRIDSDGAQIADMNSVNGTLVNDVKLTPHAWQPLHTGDRIEVGPFQMSFDQEDEGNATVVMNRTVVMPRTPLPSRPPEPPVPPRPTPTPVFPSMEPPTPVPVASTPIPDPVVPAAPPPFTAPEPFAAAEPFAPVEPVSMVPPPAPSHPTYAAPPTPERYVAPRAGREKAALVLLAIAVALTLPASFAVWNQRVLFNQDKFVSLGNKALSKPAVQNELALQLSKEIDSTNANLLKELGVPKEVEQLGKDVLDTIFGSSSSTSKPGAKPGAKTGDGLLDSIMLDTIRTLPNTPVADSALIATHTALVTAVRDSSVSTKNDVIVLDIGDGMSQLFGFAGIVGISEKDLGLNFGRIEITKNADTVRALKMIRFFDGKAIFFVVLVIVAMGAGLYLADDRVLYTKRAGLALIGSSVLWILAAIGPVKPWVVGDGGDSASAKAALKSTYDVIAGSYINQELIVIGAGVVVLAIGLLQSSRAAKAAAADGLAPEGQP